MPFSNPTVGGGSYEFDTGKYYVKVVRLEDQPEGQYGPQIKWVFEVASLDGEVITDEKGLNAELWQWSSPKISTGGKRNSKAFDWGSALMPNIDLMTLSGEEFSTVIVGKKAIALIGPKEGSQRTGILSLSPIPAKNGNAKASPAKAAAPTQNVPPEAPPDDVDQIEAAVAASADAAPW
jgi:hypothetical protein